MSGDMDKLIHENHQGRIRLLRYITVGRMASAACLGVTLVGLLAADSTPVVWVSLAFAAVAGGLFAHAGRTNRDSDTEEFLLLALSATEDRQERARLVMADIKELADFAAVAKTRLGWACGVAVIGGITVTAINLTGAATAL